MKKTTRKSFSRKAIIIIASVFLVISLTATGFAAWLISNNADGKGEGNVTASNVSDAILGVTIDSSENLGTINFGPEAGDNEGNVRAEDASDVESLTVTVTGKIGNFNTLDKMLVTVNCPDEVLTAAGYTWTGDDGARTYAYNKDKAFIALPAYAMDKDGKALPLPAGEDTTKAMTYESSLFTAGDNENEKKFSVEVKFGWGALFEGNNPGRYLDEETVSENKLTVSSENKKALLAIANGHKGSGITEDYTELSAFAKRDILNYMKTLFGSSTLKYTVVINAQAK